MLLGLISLNLELHNYCHVAHYGYIKYGPRNMIGLKTINSQWYKTELLKIKKQ